MQKLRRATYQLFFLIIIFGLQAACIQPKSIIYTQDYPFQSVAYKLAIKFPAKFDEKITSKETDEGDLKTLKVNCVVGDDLYMASATNHLAKLTNPLDLAHVSVQSFAETLKAEIKSEKIFTYKKQNGQEALLYLPQQKLYAHYRVLIAGTIQYQVIVLDAREDLSKTAKTFFESFRML